MKKTISIIAIALCLVLCMPSVPCFAYDVQDVYARTYNSVQGYWDDPDYQTWQNNLTSLSSSNSDYETIVDIVANYRSMSGYPASYDDFEHVAIFLNLDKTVLNFYFCNWSDFLWIENFGVIGSSPVYNFVTCFLGRPSNSDGAFGSVALSQPTVFTAGSWNINSLGSSEGAIWHVDTKGTILYCNFDLFCFNDYTEKGFTNPNSYQNIYTHYEDLENFMNLDLPYVDGDGVIVDPNAPEVESNSNHMYFQNCDLGFCEPTDIKNFSSFGGAYLYCKYTLDNWVINHINEYELQFNVVAAIGSEQNNFSYSMRVDRNGFVTIPFSYLFQSQSSSAIPINRGFAAVVTNQKLGSDYNIAHLYSVANSNVPNFIRTLGAEYNYNLTDLGWSALKGGSLKYLCAWVSDGGTISMNNLSEWSENVAQSFNPYILRVNVKLVSGDDSSGDYAEKFDLYAGDQSTVDTGGLVNNDPFVPDVDQDDGDLPSVPEDPNSTTPSAIVYTGGTFTGNFNGVIGFDPGYRDLKNDLNNDPNGNFSQYLDPMHNDDVGSWFMSFVNEMPTEMKSILIAGVGVGVLFGLYRFIRRG